MGNLAGFNANEVEEVSFDLVPEGRYTVIATSDERKPVKDHPHNEYLQFILEFITPGFESRKYWLRLNLWNDDPNAVRFAKSDLAAMCKAIGIPMPNDSMELLNKPFDIDMIIKKDKGGKEQNVIKRFHAVGASAAPVKSASPAASQATPRKSVNWD